MSGGRLARLWAKTGQTLLNLAASEPALSPKGELIRRFSADAIELETRPLPTWARTSLYPILTFIALAVLWSSLARMDMVVTGRGKIITTSPPLIVQPFEKLAIRSIDVAPGQVVHEGDVLATLDATFAASDSEDLRHQILSLEAELARTQSEIDGADLRIEATNPNYPLQQSLKQERRAEYESKVESLDRGISRAEAALETNRQAQAGLRESLKIGSEVEDMRADLLAKNVGSKLNLLIAQHDKVQTKMQLDERQHEEQELRQQIAGLKSDRANYIAEWQRKTRDSYVEVQRKLDSLREQLIKAERRSKLVTLTAPRDAVVLDIERRGVGGVAAEGEALMSLVPLDTPLEVEAELDGRDIGNVRVGDPVRLKIEAFPFQRHGTLNGTVHTISEDTVPPPDKTEKQQIYKARITLDTTQLENVPKDFRLLPGMNASAEIKVGRRRVISYLLYPVIRALDEGMREP
jgi:hemolysin D